MMAAMSESHSHERRFHGDAERLRTDDRIARLEVVAGLPRPEHVRLTCTDFYRLTVCLFGPPEAAG